MGGTEKKSTRSIARARARTRTAPPLLSPNPLTPRHPTPPHPPTLLPQKALTWLAYFHVAFQPLVVNLYLFAMHDDPAVKSLILRLCTVAGVGMANRLPGSPLRALGAWLNPAWAAKAPGSGFDWAAAPWPDFPPSAAAGNAGLCALDALCGPRLCSISGSRHVSWSVPLLVSV